MNTQDYSSLFDSIPLKKHLPFGECSMKLHYKYSYTLGVIIISQIINSQIGMSYFHQSLLHQKSSRPISSKLLTEVQ